MVVGKGRGFLVWCLFTGCLLACPTSELVSFREPLGSESFAEEEVDPGRVHLDRMFDAQVESAKPFNCTFGIRKQGKDLREERWDRAGRFTRVANA